MAGQSHVRANTRALMSDYFDHMSASAKSLKQWLLKNNGMSFVGEYPSLVELKVAVVRRKRRLELDSAAEPPPRGVSTALSLSQYMQKFLDIEMRSTGEKTFVSVNAKCIQIEPPLTILRCTQDKCHGWVEDGVCCSCKTATEGQLSFYLSFALVDLEDPSIKQTMVGFKKSAHSVFGEDITPQKLHDMPKSELHDVLESWMETPINIKVVLDNNAEKMKTRVTPHKAERLPLSYLTECL